MTKKLLRRCRLEVLARRPLHPHPLAISFPRLPRSPPLGLGAGLPTLHHLSYRDNMKAKTGLDGR